MVKSTAKDIFDFENNTGYTDEMFSLQADLRRYAKFISILLKLNIMPVRNAQILCSNYSQQRFEQFKKDEGLCK